MKKFIVMMAVVAFSALAFGEDAPKAPDAAASEGAMKDASKTETTTKTEKTVKKEHKHKGKKASKTEDKAM